MKLKLDENGNAVLKDGMPVYTHADGKEVPFDAAAAVNKISQLNGEAKGHRERAEELDGKLKAFEGIENADDARKALETVKNLKDGDLVTAGKVQEIRDAAKRAAEEQVAAAMKTSGEKIQALEQERDKFRDGLHNEKIGNAFAGSKFIKDKIAIPADLLRAQFGGGFRVEDGKVAAYDANGNRIFSRARPGEHADFEEGLEIMIDGYAYRDQILKGSNQSGGGSQGGGGGGGQGADGKRRVTRAEFDAMGPLDKQKAATSAEIVD